MVAERSVNCSLVSLPRTKEKQTLPLCGPLEGLALMYILKEQGALVAYDQQMLSKVSHTDIEKFLNSVQCFKSFQFESGVRAKCPAQCHFHYYQPVIVSTAPKNSINPHPIPSKGSSGHSNGRESRDSRLNSRLSNTFVTGNGNEVAILEIREGRRI